MQENKLYMTCAKVTLNSRFQHSCDIARGIDSGKASRCPCRYVLRRGSPSSPRVNNSWFLGGSRGRRGRTSDGLLTILSPPLGKGRSIFFAELLQTAEEGPRQTTTTTGTRTNRILLRVERERGGLRRPCRRCRRERNIKGRPRTHWRERGFEMHRIMYTLASTHRIYASVCVTWRNVLI